MNIADSKNVFKDLIRDTTSFLAEKLSSFPPNSCIATPSLPGASSALITLALHQLYPAKSIVVVAEGPRECESVFSDFHAFDSDSSHEPLLLLPSEDSATRSADQDGMRLAAAYALYTPTSESNIFITTPTALLSPLPDPSAIASAGLAIKSGASSPIPFSEYASHLSSIGYCRESEVVQKESYSVRGGIIDVWPLTTPLPIRIDFFGDEIDSIHEFDPVTQRSKERLLEVWLPPCPGQNFPSVAPIQKLPRGIIFLWLEYDHLETITRFPDSERPTYEAFLELANSSSALLPFYQIYTGEPPPPNTPTIPITVVSPPSLADIPELADDPSLRGDARHRLFSNLERRAKAGEQVYLCIDTAGGIEWLAHEFDDTSSISLQQAVLSGGFTWSDIGVTLLAQPDIYSTRKYSGRRLVPSSIASKGERVKRTDDLQPGDLVVHIDHGIGRFLGIAEITSNGQTQEVFSILYADDVKLHVPVSHAHLLSRYIGVAGKDVPLHKLGGHRWKSECIKAERAVVDYASALLDVQARRNAVPGYAFDVTPPWLDSFEASFSYRETKDQTACINAVKADMGSSRPMDRLICGDAGYGKTEVAMRAAFIAVMNGKQVAILAPTTILAMQHYTSFRERMAAFPVRIAVISRLQSLQERVQTLKETEEGAIDILIGTHAIIQNGVRFHDIGLVIIDEEQRFGVEHKERFKRLKATVDLLTLSATPIPRTLYMSMTGARDMSLLQTPPQERLEIETKVAHDSDAIIRSAVMREMNREGQVYFLHNRVLTIEIMYQRLKRLLPEVRIAVAHGQMKSSELSATMKSFEAGEYDLLLSTSIVESGLDIPRANTIIIHRADRFGLAELYQLRGRVGRSSRRGYAILLLPDTGIVASDARERIRAIQRHGGLSGGLNLALRDLEIRGAGNMLGAEQSGHIAAIGFGLYCQLLKRTVARLKGEAPPIVVDTELSLDFITISPGTNVDSATTACIPFSYIDDETLRMRIHRRIAEAGVLSDIQDLADELVERFGRLPGEAKRLLRLAELRIIAAQCGIHRIEVKGGVVRPFNRSGNAMLGASGLFPRLKGATVDGNLSSLVRVIRSYVREG